MKLAQVIGIIYLGIFPILPGCLCQVLEAFGVSVHDSSQLAAVCVITDRSGQLPCHCDHAEGKAFEIPESVESEIAWLNATALQQESSSGLHIGVEASSWRDRAPPGLIVVAPGPRRVFSGVFLL